ncbi:MAG: glycyl radical protein [Candidatus Helarchaeota archaeon]
MTISKDFQQKSLLKRTKQLKERLLNERNEICIERARLLTESYRKTEGEHPYIRFSKAFKNILENMTIFIQDDELIVGNRTSKPKGGPLYPEIRVDWIESDIDTISTRKTQPQFISEPDIRELKEEIIPYWKDKTIRSKWIKSMSHDERLMKELTNVVFVSEVQMINGIGHLVLNHEKIIKRGLKNIIEEIKERKDYFKSQNDLEKVSFLDAAIISAEAAILFAKRYSKLALNLAAKEHDEIRKAELEKIAEICNRVPENPASSFYEALQSLWFNQLLVQIEQGGVAISVGRMDKILYPYYKKDLENGKITPEQAQELIECFFIKMTEINNVLLTMGLIAGEGPPTAQNLIIGGIDEDGKDITSDLSYIILEAFGNIHTYQPNFSVRISKKTPLDFLKRVAQHIIQGKMMALFGDEVIIEAMRKKGFSEQDARDYGIAGCVEPNAPGMTFGSTNSNQFNAPLCLDIALKKLEDASSFEDILNAYKKEMEYYTKVMIDTMYHLDKTFAENIPSPYISINIDNCIENGKDVTQGGAKYNFTGPQLIGLASVADSLATIKKFVFDEPTFTLDEIKKILKKNFRKNKDIQQMFINKAPKFGNDDDYVDTIAREIAKIYADEVSRHENYRGGHFNPGLYSTTFYLAFGSFLEATADGRRKGNPIANGVGASNNMDINGPTALIKSAAKIDQTELMNGTVLNMRFHPQAIEDKHLVDLVRTYFDLGGSQIQFNVVSPEILRDAQEHPEDYKGLLVRIAGYSVLFTQLSKAAQNEIISRTELKCA